MLMLLAICSSANATICPKGPEPAKVLYVADATKCSLDEHFFFASIQGIAAQKQPRIYLIQDREPDEFWLAWMLKNGYVKAVKRVDVWELPSIFRSELNGAVITDPKLPASVNVATAVSGVRQFAICTPEIAAKAHLPIKADLRGRWRASQEAYSWAISHLGKDMSKQVLCSLQPYVGAGWLRDYLVQHKVFTFWIAGKNDKDRIGAADDDEAFIRSALRKWPANIPIMGFWSAGEENAGVSEYGGLVLGGESGKFTVVSDWLANASVHSGVRVPASVFKQKPEKKLKLNKSKVYVSIVQYESGDCPWYWERIQYKDWQDPARGTFPMGWCLGPATLDLMPVILQWHYEQATPNDRFFCAMSGAGYTMTPFFAKGMPDADKVWDQFLNLTSDYMKRLDLSMVSLHTDAWHAPAQYEDSPTFKRYADKMPWLKGILSDFGRLEDLEPKRAIHFTSHGIPVIHTLNRWLIEGDPAAYLAKQIRDATPEDRPGFMSVMALSWTYKPGVIRKAIDSVGPDYVFVTPTQLADLYRQSQGK